MKRALLTGGVAILGFMLGHLTMLEMIPRTMMAGAMDRIAAISGGTNLFAYPPLADDQARRVVRPSPDLAYATCVLDLGDGPVRIDAPVPDSYWSLTLFDARTDVVAVMTNDDFTDEAVVWVTNGRQVTDEDGQVVDLGTQRGIALIRLFVPDRKTYPALRETIQTQAYCKSVDMDRA